MGGFLLGKHNFIICDLDGTLCDDSHRLHNIKGPGKPDWDRYHLACVMDNAILSTLAIMLTLHEKYFIAFSSGRGEIARDRTNLWLNAQGFNLTRCEVHLRGLTDFRPVVELKRDVVKGIQAKGHNVIVALDDHPRVIALYRSMGITAYQVSDRREAEFDSDYSGKEKC